MYSNWARSAISYLTALSLMAAMVVGVFSQAHASTDVEVQTHPVSHETEPCAGHMAGPEVAEENCVTLCDTANLDHLTAALFDRAQEHDPDKTVFVYDTPHVFGVKVQNNANYEIARAPPGPRIYLTTLRLRL